MGIRVEHAPSAGLTGKVALQTGRQQGIRELEKVENRVAEVEGQRAFQAESQERSFQNQSTLAEEAYQRRVLDREDQQQFQTMGADAQRQFQAEQVEIQQKNRLEAMTEPQRQQAIQYQGGIDKIVGAENLTEDEKGKAMQAWRRKFPNVPQSIIDMADAGEDLVGSQFPEGQQIGAVWEGDDGGTYTRDDKGNVKNLVKPERVSPGDYAKMRAEAYKVLTIEDMDGNRTIPTPDEVDDYIGRTVAGYTKYSAAANRLRSHEQVKMDSPEPEPEVVEEPEEDLVPITQGPIDIARIARQPITKFIAPADLKDIRDAKEVLDSVDASDEQRDAARAMIEYQIGKNTILKTLMEQ